MLFLEKPDSFDSRFEIVSCFVESEGDILLLLRQDHKSEPNTYGVPAGKVELGEDIDTAIMREVFEETWLQLDDIAYFRETYVRYETHDITYHMFHARISGRPDILINPEEHKKYIWRTPEKALEETLMQDEDECIRLFYGI